MTPAALLVLVMLGMYPVFTARLRNGCPGDFGGFTELVGGRG